MRDDFSSSFAIWIPKNNFFLSSSPSFLFPSNCSYLVLPYYSKYKCWKWTILVLLLTLWIKFSGSSKEYDVNCGVFLVALHCLEEIFFYCHSFDCFCGDFNTASWLWSMHSLHQFWNKSFHFLFSMIDT